MIQRKTITYNNEPLSLNWQGDRLIDWVGGGNLFYLNGDFRHSQRGYAYRFDSAIQSENGVYAVVYEKLGTKALLLKNGEIIRELNRSYYQAGAYEYPIAFLMPRKDEYAIVHCPNEYNLIEIEMVETGERLTSFEGRNPNDCFHSRFRVSPGRKILLNTGWVWHPYGICQLYNLAHGLRDNSVFDRYNNSVPIESEVCSADFLTDDLLVISSTREAPLDEEEAADVVNLQSGQLALFSIEKNKFLKKNNIQHTPGTLIPLNERYVMDLYEYPKLLDMDSGQVIEKFEDINSGKQDLAIMHHIDMVPPVAFDRFNKQLAIANGNKIELLKFNL